LLRRGFFAPGTAITRGRGIGGRWDGARSRRGKGVGIGNLTMGGKNESLRRGLSVKLKVKGKCKKKEKAKE